jgi:hypothetical protein
MTRKFLEVERTYIDSTGKEWKCVATGSEAHMIVDKKGFIYFIPQGDEDFYQLKEEENDK